jgi:hypothetical protein
MQRNSLKITLFASLTLGLAGCTQHLSSFEINHLKEQATYAKYDCIKAAKDSNAETYRVASMECTASELEKLFTLYKFPDKKSAKQLTDDLQKIAELGDNKKITDTEYSNLLYIRFQGFFREYADNVNEIAERRQAVGMALGAGLQNVGNTYTNMARQPIQPVGITPFRCTGIGNSVTCY